MIEKKIILNSGYQMPMVGLGTWKLEKDKIEKCIRVAIKEGYKHIDTASRYGNEEDIGNCLQKLFKENIIKREEIFITSKLWNACHKNPEHALRKTLKDLKINYVDLYLIHWPVTFATNDEGKEIYNENGENVLEEFDCVILCKKMEELVEKGLVKSIGISNFGFVNIEKILKNCKIKPAVNQIEINPYFTQKDLVEYCQEKSIQVVSYSSLGSSNPSVYNLREDSEIKAISLKYKKTVPQIILSWLIMRNIMVIPKSSSENHIKENIDLISLERDDFITISKLDKNFRFVDPVRFGHNRFK